jgi:hypothetical protein
VGQRVGGLKMSRIVHTQEDELLNLFDSSMSMSPKMEKMEASNKDSRDTYSLYADGSELLCRDACTSTFHPKCLAINVLEGS